MGYSVGKFALGLCDRCGFEYKLNDLKEEWNKLKTCPQCFEPKAPQLNPSPVVSDKEALYKPRPNNDIEGGDGFVVISDANQFTNTSNNFLSMNSNILGSAFSTPTMTASLGSVTITV
tara:strand:+ start:1350 stop:1703 length:354 start_codon:yes stop_codon:yes gene_type:complete